MKRPSFFEGVAVALAASIAGGVLYTALLLVLPASLVLRVLIAGIGLVYIVYLLRRSRVRVGRVTTLIFWAGMAAMTWLAAPSFTVYVLVHVSSLWLIRSLYFYSSVFAALADLTLTGFSLAAAFWAATQSGSITLSVWCFFLIQALFVSIPTNIHDKNTRHHPVHDGEDRFQQAHRAAEAALRKLS